MSRVAMPANHLNDQVLVRTLEARMARDQPLTPTRREFCCSSAAALVGLSIKGDRPVAGAFVNDD